MAKQGMKRPEYEHRKNNQRPVPQINGKARSGKEKAAPLVADGTGKVWHDAPYGSNDLAMDNMRDSFDLTAADQQDSEL